MQMLTSITPVSHLAEITMPFLADYIWISGGGLLLLIIIIVLFLRR